MLDRIRRAYAQSRTNDEATADVIALMGGATPAQRALNLSVVCRCVSLVAGAIASCPIQFREDSYPRLQHVLQREANPLMSGYELIEWMVIRMLLDGNAYVRIARGRDGAVSGLYPLHGVEVRFNERTNALTYVDSQKRTYDFTQVLHYRSQFLDILSMTGKSLLETGASNAVDIGTAAELTAKTFYRKATLGQHVLHVDRDMTKKQQKDMRKGLQDRIASGTDSLGEIFIVPKGVQHSVLQLNAEKMQLIQSRSFQVEDFGRAIGVASIFLNQESKSTSFGSGVRSIGQFLVHYTLMSHVNRLEGELNRKLVLNRESPIMLDTSWLTQGDLKDRFAAYVAATGGPFATTNEMRDLERMEALTPEQLAELNSGNGNANAAAGNPAPEQDGPPADDPEDPTEQE